MTVKYYTYVIKFFCIYLKKVLDILYIWYTLLYMRNEKNKRGENKMKTYETKREAETMQRIRNNSLVKKDTKNMLFLVDGPEDNYSLVDFRTAREIGHYSF